MLANLIHGTIPQDPKPISHRLRLEPANSLRQNDKFPIDIREFPYRRITFRMNQPYLPQIKFTLKLGVNVDMRQLSLLN
jgi:hypothetical protein